MLNLWRLKLLLQFHALGTMQQVSEVMCTSIATVSQQLSLLEKETNRKLFEKVGRRVQLTHEGQALVKKVRPVLNQLEDIESDLNDTSEEIQGTVRIAAFTSALDKRIVPVIAKLAKRYPKLQVRLTEIEPDISIPALDAYQFDLVIVAYAEKTHLLEQSHRKVVKLGQDRLMILLSDENPLAKKSHVSIEDLQEENWILEAEGSYLSDYANKLCRSAGFEPNVTHVVQSYLLMHSMIAENLGISILPELAIIKSIKGISVREIQSEATREIYLVTRENKSTTRAMNIVTEALANIVY